MVLHFVYIISRHSSEELEPKLLVSAEYVWTSSILCSCSCCHHTALVRWHRHRPFLFPLEFWYVKVLHIHVQVYIMIRAVFALSLCWGINVKISNHPITPCTILRPTVTVTWVAGIVVEKEPWCNGEKWTLLFSTHLFIMLLETNKQKKNNQKSKQTKLNQGKPGNNPTIYSHQYTCSFSNSLYG